MQCFVCGAGLEEDAPCSQCNNPPEVQHRLLKNTQQKRFLFGRVKQGDLGLSEVSQSKERRPQPAPKPKPKPKPKMARPIYEQSAHSELDIDVIHSRDQPIMEPKAPEPVPNPAPIRFRTFSHLLDVAICMLLNYSVFLMILGASGRHMNPLVHFSMIPLTFVLLSFTALYFWLFVMLFGKSLGRMILEHIVESHTP